MNRDIKLNFRVSQHENEIIQTKVRKANASVSAYIRSAALNRNVVNIDGLREMIPELNRIGNNLNQTTVLLRQNRISNPYFQQLKEDFSRLIEVVEDKFKGRY